MSGRGDGADQDGAVISALLKRPTVGGALFALGAWWWSLPPTLLPRTWFTQSVISAVCIGVAYMVGTLLGWLVHLVLNRQRVVITPKLQSGVHRAVGALWIVAILASLVCWTRWQNQQRALVEMDDIGPFVVVFTLLGTAVFTAVLTAIGRSFHALVNLVDRGFTRRGLVPHLANMATAVFLAVGIYALVTAVIQPGVLAWANDKFGGADEGTEAGVEPPTNPEVSGSPDSLVAWDTLGLQGRSFVGGAPTIEELEAFSGTGAINPIRVYAGIDSADDVNERAALVVEELERTDAFDRSVLVIYTATGTGWVDPASSASLEYMHAGDTAIASMQYSFFPSWISFLVDGEQAQDAGQALYDAIHARWLEEPEATRPRLIVFGQSLGSFGAETPFVGDDATSSVASYRAGADGYFFTGPTYSNAVWGQIVSDRDAGSPSWEPVFDDGETVVAIVNNDELTERGAGWTDPRVLYVHHPTDPVGTWNWQTLWSSPEWVDQPVGVGVPEGVRWWPFVTFVQEVGDLIQGFSTDAGWGHNYTNAFVAGWAEIAPADGWTSGDTQRLMNHVDQLD